MSKFVTCSQTFEKMRAAGMFEDDPRTIRRVVIDLTAGSVAKLYVERFVDNEQLDVALEAELTVERQ